MPKGLRQTIITRLGITRVAASVDVVAADVARLQQQVDQLSQQVAGAPRVARIPLNTALVAALPAPPTRISVVLPTRDRARLLQRAIESVQRQTHTNWQLVVVDDASTDDTPQVVARAGDERIVSVRGEGRGSSAARNLGIARADGEWVAFLDDDNVLDPGWLHAIALFGERSPHTPLLYGAQLRQHEPADGDGGFPEAYTLFPDPLWPSSLLVDNTIDLGMIAVRAGTDGLYFDETLRRFVDWDLVVRLVARYPYRAVPVWSSVYNSLASSRITHTSDQAEIDAFRRRFTVDPTIAPVAAALRQLDASLAAPAPNQP